MRKEGRRIKDRAVLNTDGVNICVGKRGRNKRIIIELVTPEAGTIEVGTVINSQQYAALINWSGRNATRHWADELESGA